MELDTRIFPLYISLVPQDFYSSFVFRTALGPYSSKE